MISDKKVYFTISKTWHFYDHYNGYEFDNEGTDCNICICAVKCLLCILEITWKSLFNRAFPHVTHTGCSVHKYEQKN